MKKTNRQIKKETLCQFFYSSELCSNRQVSKIVNAPTKIEVENRKNMKLYKNIDQEDRMELINDGFNPNECSYSEDALFWNDDLLESSPEDGKMICRQDYNYFEGTEQEIMELIESWKKSNNFYYMETAKALQQQEV